ncbi:hypothetical protein DM47_1224 [Burkholderia mallei]|nr:hypothetical protein DO70_4958 [Burkholderia pseudomallei]KGX95564.1 hypothetical protein Y023_5362 [Burkholderia pseudomallei A79D]KGX96275.1 hypothetical protein X997_5147 [Burkholderia pseudomallei A79C]KOS75390.1 hypothetical protein DM46_1535 [Burkholderia mallei]KOS89740.1 hypothetical protein DM45_1800 [Burkholderia mallei]
MIAARQRQPNRPPRRAVFYCANRCDATRMRRDPGDSRHVARCAAQSAVLYNVSVITGGDEPARRASQVSVA